MVLISDRCNPIYDRKRVLPLFSNVMSAAIVAVTIVLAIPTAHGENAPTSQEPTHSESHEEDRNWAALFIGVTGEERRNGKPALGLEYARHLNPSFAIGGIVEYTFGDDSFWVLAVPFAYQPGPWKFYVAPGLEVEEIAAGPSESELLLRVGVEYAFEVGEIEVAPQLDIDFVDGDQVFIFGVTIGTTF